MSLAFWDDSPDLWDTVIIGPVDGLGLATVTVRKGGQVDAKKETGSDHTVHTHLGYEPAQVQISIRMWLQSHLDAYQDLLEFIQSKDVDKVPDPIDVYHPTLALHGIYSLYFMLSEPPKATSTKGVWEVVLIAQEWTPKTKEEKKDLTPSRSTSVSDGSIKTAMPLAKDAPPPSLTPLPFF